MPLEILFTQAYMFVKIYFIIVLIELLIKPVLKTANNSQDYTLLGWMEPITYNMILTKDLIKTLLEDKFIWGETILSMKWFIRVIKPL